MLAFGGRQGCAGALLEEAAAGEGRERRTAWRGERDGERLLEACAEGGLSGSLMVPCVSGAVGCGGRSQAARARGTEP